MKKIVYIVGGLLTPNGMSSVLSSKINWLAANTDYELYMVLTEKAGEPWYYHISEKVKWVNFDVNFDELDTMPIYQKVVSYARKQRRYKRLLTDYLMQVRPDITVSALRREINFINDIGDGSHKVGEIHFDRTYYRQFNKPWLPGFVNKAVTRWWVGGLIDSLRRLDRFVVLTHEDEAHWPELDNKTVIPNSLPCLPAEQAALVNRQVIAVGRYSWQKGFDLLIEAWALVAERHPDWVLNIYGPGESAVYQKMADGMGLAGKVCCHPPVSHIYEKYLESSVFVLSSRYEGFGLVLAEAMSVGLPGVSFACPCGPSEIVTDGQDGILVPAGSVEQLAEALIRLMDDSQLRHQYGTAAKANMQRYAQPAIMHQWVTLFDSLEKI